MSEWKKGVILSVLFHLLVLGSLFFGERILSDSRESQPFQIGFSFYLKPLGNTLEKPVSPSDRTPRPVEKRKVTEKGYGAETPAPAEKRYGVSDGTEGVDEFYISKNFKSIMGTISNRLLYPEIARSMGWEGRVLVPFVIDTDGTIKEIRIQESSGFAILDSSAIKTIRSIRGIPLPRTPTRITLPIAFSLH